MDASIPNQSKSAAQIPFKSRDRVPPLLPSDVLGAWKVGAPSMPWDVGATFNLFDPVFHPGESDEYRLWVAEAVREIVTRQKQLKDGLKSGGGSPRDFQDCDDSAFNFKSAASAYRQSPLAAPLCVGVVGCRTADGREHVVNWIVSVDIVGDRAAKHPKVEYRLWFCDVQALVEAFAAGWDGKSEPPVLEGGPKLVQLLASPEVAAKYLKLPFIVLA